MTTIIRSHNFSMSAEVRAHLARRFTWALRRFERRISRVEVSVRDLNGAVRGGEDIQVRAKISLNGVGTVVVTAVACEPLSAISIAARRTRRSVKRTIWRFDAIDHYGLRQLAGYSPDRPLLESG